MRRRGGDLNFLVVSLLLAVFAGAGNTATRYVSPWEAGLPHMTPEMAGSELQWAIDHAQEGDEIIVGAGRYSGNITLHRGINLSGSQRDGVVICGAAPKKPVLTLTCDNIVKRLTILGSPFDGSGIYAELEVPPAKTGILKPFEIRESSIGSCAGSGILIFAKQEVWDSHLFLEHYGSLEGWHSLRDSPYDAELEVAVSDCHVARCGGNGIVVHVDDPLGRYEGLDSVVPGGEIELGFKHATLRMSQCSIEDCYRDGARVRVGWGDRARVIMDRCVVRDNGRYGVYTSSPGGTPWGAVTQVTNSLICRNGEAGIWSFSIHDGLWCTPPFGGTCIGVEPFALGGVFATSCTIAGNPVGIVGSPFPPGMAAGTVPRISLKNCIVYGNKEVDIDFRWFEYAVLMAGGIRHSCVGWKELAGVRGNIDSDPLFPNPQWGLCTLPPGSPCIDAGGMYFQPTLIVQDGAPLISWDPGKDLDGNARISGNGPDMGAYEAPGEAANYLLQTSEDLANWTEEYYGPATSWTDPDAESPGTKFYRVRVGR